VQLHRAREQFEQAGAGLVLIGQTTPRHAKRFHAKLGLDGLSLLADEERRTYAVAGFERANLTQLVGPRSVVSGLRHGARSGVMQGRPVGDIAQLGGAIVIAPDGTVAFRHASRHAGDTVDPADLLDAAADAGVAAR
jgi:hypothetical protein